MKRLSVVLGLAFLLSLGAMAANVDFVTCCTPVCLKTSCSMGCDAIDKTDDFKKMYDDVKVKNLLNCTDQASSSATCNARHRLSKCALDAKVTKNYDVQDAKYKSCISGDYKVGTKVKACEWISGIKDVKSMVADANGNVSGSLRDLFITGHMMNSAETKGYFKALIKYAFENGLSKWQTDLIEIINNKNFGNKSPLLSIMVEDPDLFSWMVNNLGSIKADALSAVYADDNTSVKFNCFDKKYGSGSKLPERFRSTQLMYTASLPGIDHGNFCAMYDKIKNTSIDNSTATNSSYKGTFVAKDKGVTALECYTMVSGKVCP